MNAKIQSATNEIDYLKESEEKCKSELLNQNQTINSLNSTLDELKQTNNTLLHEKQTLEINYNQLKQVIIFHLIHKELNKYEKLKYT